MELAANSFENHITMTNQDVKVSEDPKAPPALQLTPPNKMQAPAERISAWRGSPAG